ncbi:S9 family peptidase [Sphingomonas nostoxanthinifaciens]|uniref:S9 family peptidase n=1 Tax=Sphingomonas nostoxanthinifaciens TaxID=2872652 RepID=UPI001CC20A31|nr:prolyl oligopeptidase family serine peptidase [Sphingomonas nostoxanthinifaciens]UAK25468.1 prolyl oligopeptidase family serine peptidase [Sphingomonas nostoxanthinifaciens]
MHLTLLRAVALLMAIALVTAPPPLAARPYAVDELLATEAFGKILVSPDGRWLVFERQVPFEQSPRFEQQSMDVLRGRLYVVDLTRPAAARPLVPIEPGTGMIVYGFSPRGSRLAIARLARGCWQLGVVTLANGAVRWFGVTPDYYPWRTTLGWVSEDRLVTITQPGKVLPWIMRTNLQDANDLPAAWAAKQAGIVPTLTAIGSGHHIDLKPPPLPTALVMLDVISGETQPLARGDLQSLTVSPDGRHVALIEERETNLINATDPIGEATDLRRRRLLLIDLPTRRVRVPCRSCDLPFYPPVWSASGRRLLFYGRSPGTRWRDGSPYLIDADGAPATALPMHGVRTAVLSATGDYDRVGLGWLGETPIVYGRADVNPASRADWYRIDPGGSEALTLGAGHPSSRIVTGTDGTVAMLAGAEAWALEKSGARRILSGVTRIASLPTSILCGSFQQQTGAIVLGWAPGSGTAWLATASGDPVRFRGSGAGDAQPITASRAAEAIVETVTQVNGVQQLVVGRRDGAPVTVARLNARLAGVTAAAPVLVRHVLPGGRQVTSWLYLPAARGDGVKPPLIVIPYAGTVYGDTPPANVGPGIGYTFTNVAVLVGHGYAVLLPSMPKLAAADDHPFDLAGQVLAAVDTVIARGSVDPERLGIWGHSFGGYTAATIATETNRFKAIVAADGIYDFASSEGTFTPSTRMNPGYFQSIVQWAGWTESEQPNLQATPWSDPARYVANSPLYHADRIATPMLLIATDRDFAPLQQSEQLFSALYRQGKDAQLVTYWGEDHVLVSPANVRDSYARVFDWFDSHFRSSEGRGG